MEDSKFEIHGYNEEIWNVKTRKCLGFRRCEEQAERRPGVYGEQNEVLTAPTEISRGHKKMMVKASKEKPLAIFTRYYPIFGRTI